MVLSAAFWLIKFAFVSLWRDARIIQLYPCSSILRQTVRESRVIGPTTRTSVALELGPPLNMATDGPGD
ncbi:hypothetical protein ANTRET_LOCUS7223 [Anthophora retusa]